MSYFQSLRENIPTKEKRWFKNKTVTNCIVLDKNKTQRKDKSRDIDIFKDRPIAIKTSAASDRI